MAVNHFKRKKMELKKMDARRDFDAPFVIDPASLRLIAVRINKNTATMHIVAIKLALKAVLVGI